MTTAHILFRCDASPEIGTGHIRRCIALASALREFGAEITFAVRDLGIDYSAIFGPEWNVRMLPPPAGDAPAPEDTAPHSAWARVPQAYDAEQLIKVFADARPDWVVVDHYAFDAAWHGSVRAGLGCKIAVIDDLADRPLAADLIVDHNYHPDHGAKYAAVTGGDTPILGGPKYALLGPAYAHAPRYEFHETVRSIGVFMGGTDPDGVSEIVLKAIKWANFNGPVELVTTSSSPSVQSLRDAASAMANVELTLDLPNLASFFGRHDVQIGAGGGALWERFCVGTPTIGLICAENQRNSIPYLDRIGALVGFDFLNSDAHGDRALSALLENLIKDTERRKVIHDNAMCLVDGHGANRVAERLVKHD